MMLKDGVGKVYSSPAWTTSFGALGIERMGLSGKLKAKKGENVEKIGTEVRGPSPTEVGQLSQYSVASVLGCPPRF